MMNKYIEREKVLELIRSVSRDIEDVPEDAFPKNYADGWKDGLETVADKVENLFAADVRPERHGEWFGTVCTNCGASTSFYYDCNYCPNCGAKMDGKDEKNGIST